MMRRGRAKTGSRGQSLTEMALVLTLVSLGLFSLLGAFRLGAERAAREMLLAITLPLP
jgi:hypothetical protein